MLVPAITICNNPNELRPRSALQAAVEHGHLLLIDELLAAGADVNGPWAMDGGASALQLGAAKGYLGIARRLLELGRRIVS
jgi:ankyrin repeat protein